MRRELEFGLSTFGDVNEAPDGRLLQQADVIRNVIDEAVLSDQVGVDFFGVGEHHRPDFAISSPDIVLALIAGRTDRIRLGSATTILSSDDPVRVFQRFSTLSAASSGRAEVILGRGWFVESFALFDYKREDYDALFEDKLRLFTQLLRNEVVTWQGKGRSPLKQQRVYPGLSGNALMTWVAVGSTPESVIRAARYDLPMMLAIIGGPADRSKPLVDLYRSALERLGRAPQPVGVHSTGYVAETDEKARDEFWPYYKSSRDKLGLERGWPAITRQMFDNEIESGSLYVGSPTTVAEKICDTVIRLDIDRFQIKYSNGMMGHEKLMSSIELYGREVIRGVRKRMELKEHMRQTCETV